MTMILLGRKRAKKRRNPHFSTRRKWCEKWLGAPSDDATASLEIVGESSETAKMMMTANLWCWGRKKYRQSMLCARQVACVLRERGQSYKSKVSFTWLFTDLWIFAFPFWDEMYQTNPTWKYFQLSRRRAKFYEGLKITFCEERFPLPYRRCCFWYALLSFISLT